MKKGKRAQASLTIAILLLFIIMIVIVVAVVIILIRPEIFNFQQQTPTVIIKTIERSEERIVCMYPFRQLGNTCCMDSDLNNICDSDEIKRESLNYCSSPYIKDGTSCCLDEDRNRICDKEEYYEKDRIERAYLDDPFDISDVDIERDELTIVIKNVGDEAVTIKNIDVDDCDDINPDKTLEKNERKTFHLDCDFPRYVDSDIEVEYTSGNSTSIKTSDGNIREERYEDYY